MTGELSEKCGTCRFMFETETDRNLQKATVCRRFPPVGQVIPGPGGAVQIAFFPAIQATHWCGEYQLSRVVFQ